MSNRDFRGKVGGCGGGEFANQTNNWRTPNSQVIEPKSNIKKLAARTPDDPQVGLDQVNIWQTPGTDSFRSRGGQRKDEMGLDQQARNCGTPRTSDYKGSAPMGSKSQAHMEGKGYLCAQTEHWLADFDSPLVQPIPGGPQSSPQDRTSRRRLNPRFVEWLMGFPVTWTELCATAPNDSAASETP